MAGRVLLTGANGFIGSHILSELLQADYLVCCTVRAPGKGDKILEDFAAYKSQISISVVPDITTPGAYDEAVQGSFDSVFHTASPFIYGVVSDNREFLNPAINGTTGLLKSIKENAPSVRRVIYTSSCAAVINYDRLASGDTYNEQSWNPISWDEAVNGDQSKAYRASKKFAELAGESPHRDCNHWPTLNQLDSVEIHGR